MSFEASSSASVVEPLVTFKPLMPLTPSCFSSLIEGAVFSMVCRIPLFTSSDVVLVGSGSGKVADGGAIFVGLYVIRLKTKG